MKGFYVSEELDVWVCVPLKQHSDLQHCVTCNNKETFNVFLCHSCFNSGNFCIVAKFDRTVNHKGSPREQQRERERLSTELPVLFST